MASFEFLEDDQSDSIGQARFTVFGVGGAGGNAVQHMLESDIQGVKFVCANTDKQALDRMNAQFKIQLGEQSTRGLGAGANPQVGQTAAEESRELIRQHLEGTDMVFVTAGMGGGTGTGAAPVVAEIAKEMGILTVGVVTTPFNFEGKRRQQSAEKGIEALEAHVDSLIIIPNQRLLKVFRDISMKDAYKKADDVLLNAVRSIFDLVVRPGHINLDFADLKTIVKKLVVEPFDHAFIYHTESARECEIAAMLEGWQLKTLPMAKRTTAENMAQYMFDLLRNEGRLNVSALRLWETPTSYCECSA